MKQKMFAIIIAGFSILVAAGVIDVVPSLGAVSSPQWFDQTGEGITVPACSSSSPSATCEQFNSRVTISWSYDDNHGTCAYVNVTIQRTGENYVAYSQPCSGSYTFLNLNSNATYDSFVDFHDSAGSLLEQVKNSVNTPNCPTPPVISGEVVGSNGERATLPSGGGVVSLPLIAGDPTFNWSVSGADSCSWNTGWTGLSGSQSIVINTFGDYSLTCTNAGGSLTTTVQILTTPFVDIKANGSNGPITIFSGDTVNLSWSSIDATSCALSPGGPAVTSGSKLVAPTSNQTYSMICTNTNGSGSDFVTINVTPSSAPVAVSKISVDGVNYSSSVSVYKGEPTRVYLSSAESSDPDGWTNTQTGVSSGGRCEWNSALRQGSFLQDKTILNPPSPEACSIDLGTLTFNDRPGTYTYNVLQIMDRQSKLSNIGQVSVSVLPIGATCTGSPATADIGQPVTWTAVGKGGEFPSDQINRFDSLPRDLFIYGYGSDGNTMLIFGQSDSGSSRTYQIRDSGWSAKINPPITGSWRDFAKGNLMDDEYVHLITWRVPVGQTGHYRYNTITETWQSGLKRYPGFFSGTGATLNGKIYMYEPIANNLYEYSIAGDAWTTKKKPNRSRDYTAKLVALNGKIYLIGGAVANNEEYDPDTNLWTTKTPTPSGVSVQAASVLGGKIYVFTDSSGTVYNYNPITNTWQNKTFSDSRWPPYSPAVGTRGNSIFIAGGTNSSGSSPQDNAWQYQPRYSFTWSGTDSLSGSGESIQKTYSTGGVKSASVTVTDGINTAGPLACTNSVAVGPLSPLASTGSGHTIPLDENHSHAGATATDPNGNLKNFTWSLLSCPGPCPAITIGRSGNIAGGLTSVAIDAPTFKPAQRGDYVLELEVKDTTDLSDRKTVTEHVLFECEDTIDNDGDTKIDFPVDPECTGPSGTEGGGVAPGPSGFPIYKEIQPQ